jgi:hypothetical protein
MGYLDLDICLVSPFIRVGFPLNKSVVLVYRCFEDFDKGWKRFSSMPSYL